MGKQLEHQLHKNLEGVRVQKEGEDYQFWKESSLGKYTTKSTYQMLRDLQEVEDPIEFFYQLWRIKFPNKSKLLLQRLFSDRLPTKSNLKSRNVIVQDNDFTCPLCLSCNESAQHLFTSCNVVHHVWLDCYSWKSTDLNIVLPESWDVHLWQHKGLAQPGTKSDVWLVIWCAVIFCVRNLWNAVIFRQENVDKRKLLEDIKFVSWSWLHSSFRFQILFCAVVF